MYIQCLSSQDNQFLKICIMWDSTSLYSIAFDQVHSSSWLSLFKHILLRAELLPNPVPHEEPEK